MVSTSVGRSLWTCHGCAYSSQVSVRHYGTTGYERTPWCGYCHWIAYVWGWACVQGPSQLLYARGLLSEFSIWCRLWSVTGKEQLPYFTYLPPLVIAEALQDNVSHWCKIRRLHLIVVDTWSPWQSTPLRSEQWLTWWNTWQTLQKCDVWFPWCRKAAVFLPDAVGLSTGTPLITQNFLVICFGPVVFKQSIGDILLFLRQVMKARSSAASEEHPTSDSLVSPDLSLHLWLLLIYLSRCRFTLRHLDTQ